MAVVSRLVSAIGGGRSGLGVRSALKRVLRGGRPEQTGADNTPVAPADPPIASPPVTRAAPQASPAEAKAPEPQPQVAEAAPEPVAKATAPESTAPEPAPAPAPKIGGFAAAARNAAASGLDTGATFRRAAPGEGKTDNGLATNDVIIGETYDSEVRIAEDGVAFWGPIDNDSARAKAAQETLDIDRDECIGCGTCVEHIDTVFFLNDDEGKAYVIAQEGAMDRIEDAIDACPVTCISWQS